MENKPVIFKGAVAADDRGKVSFVNDFNFNDVKRFYMVENYESLFIRAWHAHKNEGKYVSIVNGAAIIGLIDLTHIKDWEKINTLYNEFENISGEEDDLIMTQIYDAQTYRYILNSNTPSVIWIPPGFANGAKTLLPNTKLIYYSTKTLEESKDDDFRFDYQLRDNIWEVYPR